MQPTVTIINLGLIEYKKAEAFQEEVLQQVRQGEGAFLLLLEHPPTITFGRHGGEENLPREQSYFTQKGVTVTRATRGGNITCHFPGQLVAYPFIAIGKRRGGLKKFFYDMEEVILRTLAHYNLKAHRHEGRPGVWIKNRKIASIGIAAKHWITSHGISLNVSRDLSLFEEITPCGLPGVTATSLHKELDRDDIPMDHIKEVFADTFCSVFALQRQNMPSPFC